MWGLCLLVLGYIGLSPVPFLASLIGTTEPALKLLISILMAYPMAIFYHKYVRQTPVYRNYFFIITGLDTAFYNFGVSLYHNVIPAVVILASTKLLGPGMVNAAFSFVFNMTYLIVGYIYTESEDYDITWTMPHCVLTLKLIALAFDLWDGQKPESELSANSKKTALKETPGFMELLGFVYFAPCFLVGPMFSMKRYQDFIEDKFPLDAEAQVYENYAFKRLLQGIAYLICFQVGVSVFSMTYMMSPEFSDTSIVYRHFYCGLWAHFALYKYISCWLLTEASCARFGFSYNGMGASEPGTGAQSRWDGCTNIKLMRFECATKFQHYIDSFNCNTNYFAAEYVYKRLKFLGNRSMSQLLTLLFLAVWHGTQSGYYVTFFNEFIIILMEKDLEAMISNTVFYRNMWSSNNTKFLLYALLKTYTIVFMGWSLVPISVKTLPKWFALYQSLWFSGFVLFVPWKLVYRPLLKNLMKTLNVERVKTE